MLGANLELLLYGDVFLLLSSALQRFHEYGFVHVLVIAIEKSLIITSGKQETAKFHI